MWHFAMDAKDASELDRSKLASHGINNDPLYGGRIIAQFKNEHPRWNDRSSDYYGEVDFLDELVFFTVDKPEPETKEQAIKFVTDVCFWAPVLVTQGGQMIEVADYQDENQVRFTEPD